MTDLGSWVIIFREPKCFVTIKTCNYSGDEIAALVLWMWSSFNEGKDLSHEQKLAEAEKLLKRQDANGDGTLSFEEFGKYFVKTAESIGKFKKKQAYEKKKQAEKHKDEKKNAADLGISSLAFELTPQEKNAITVELTRARKKFNQLDVNGTNSLEGERLFESCTSLT